MITKQEYLEALKIVKKYEIQQEKFAGIAVIYDEGRMIAKVKKEELKEWLDNFFAEKLKNTPKKYSQRTWDNLKNYEIFVDGEAFVLPYYDKDLLDKWF